MKLSKGRWIVEFREAKKPVRRTIAPPADLVAQLTDRSVNPRKAAALASSHARHAIEEKIRYYDAQRRRGKTLRPGFLVSSIEQKYQFPAETLPPITCADHRAHVAPALRTAAPSSVTDRQTDYVRNRQERIRQDYWSSLPETAKQQIEAEAFEQAGRLELVGWRRANETGLKQIAAAYRDAILNKHIDRLLARRKES
jgi:hypothetical protein